MRLHKPTRDAFGRNSHWYSSTVEPYAVSLTVCSETPGIAPCQRQCALERVQVVELWTRRRFRCDCGNSKFGGAACQLCPDKEPENAANVYNQNYKGVYCYCKRPYPDPEKGGAGDNEEDNEEEDMSQCVVCEDWFHDSHMGQVKPQALPPRRCWVALVLML